MEKSGTVVSGKSKRGFASMDPARQREIASKGGKSAHAMGKRFKFTSEQASNAALIAHARGTAHEFNSEEARAAGRKGGLARWAKVRAQQAAAAAPATPEA